MKTIPESHVTAVCRPGDKKRCCAYLASKGLPHFFCAKSDPPLLLVIRKRLAEGTMGAKGDNCSGPPDYVVPESP